MDPLRDFADLLGPRTPSPDRLHVPELFDSASLLRALVDSAPTAIIVHGKTGSGRTVLALKLRALLYEHRLHRHVAVCDEHEHAATSTRLIRRAVDAAVMRAADLLTIFVTMPTKLRVDGVLSVATRDAMSESALRAAYDTGTERLTRVYRGSLVRLHNHRVHGIFGGEPCTGADCDVEAAAPRVRLLLLDRRGSPPASLDGPDAASYADVLLGKSRHMELDPADGLLMECALILLRGSTS
jgi:hypothetical protein